MFIASGALSGFSVVFSLVLLPPYLLASALLLVRFLAAPKEAGQMRVVLRAVEGLAWLVVIGFLYLVSGVNLLSGLERFGAVCTFFLPTSVAAAVWLLVRPTRLETRLASLSRVWVTLVVIAIVTISTIAMGLYLGKPSTFIR